MGFGHVDLPLYDRVPTWRCECVWRPTQSLGCCKSLLREAHVRQFVQVVLPLQHADFGWPTAISITESQRVAIEEGETIPTDVEWSEENSVYTDQENRT